MRLYALILAGVLLAAVVPTALVVIVATMYANGLPGPIFVASGVGLVLAGVLAVTLARRVTRPLEGFREFAMNIARGKFGGQVEHRADDELGELAFDSIWRGWCKHAVRWIISTLI